MAKPSKKTEKWLTRLSVLLIFLGQFLFWEHLVSFGYFDIELVGHENVGIILTLVGMISLLWLKRGGSK